jgi:hypothetical protein
LIDAGSLVEESTFVNSPGAVLETATAAGGQAQIPPHDLVVRAAYTSQLQDSSSSSFSARNSPAPQYRLKTGYGGVAETDQSMELEGTLRDHTTASRETLKDPSVANSVINSTSPRRCDGEEDEKEETSSDVSVSTSATPSSNDENGGDELVDMDIGVLMSRIELSQTTVADHTMSDVSSSLLRTTDASTTPASELASYRDSRSRFFSEATILENRFSVDSFFTKASNNEATPLQQQPDQLSATIRPATLEKPMTPRQDAEESTKTSSMSTTLQPSPSTRLSQPLTADNITPTTVATAANDVVADQVLVTSQRVAQRKSSSSSFISTPAVLRNPLVFSPATTAAINNNQPKQRHPLPPPLSPPPLLISPSPPSSPVSASSPISQSAAEGVVSRAGTKANIKTIAAPATPSPPSPRKLSKWSVVRSAVKARKAFDAVKPDVPWRVNKDQHSSRGGQQQQQQQRQQQGGGSRHLYTHHHYASTDANGVVLATTGEVQTTSGGGFFGNDDIGSSTGLLRTGLLSDNNNNLPHSPAGLMNNRTASAAATGVSATGPGMGGSAGGGTTNNNATAMLPFHSLPDGTPLASPNAPEHLRLEFFRTMSGTRAAASLSSSSMPSSSSFPSFIPSPSWSSSSSSSNFWAASSSMAMNNSFPVTGSQQQQQQQQQKQTVSLNPDCIYCYLPLDDPVQLVRSGTFIIINIALQPK